MLTSPINVKELFSQNQFGKTLMILTISGRKANSSLTELLLQSKTVVLDCGATN